MMDQLGIKALRPGPSGNEKAPNHANNDESLANPYNNVPDPLVMNDGRKVTTAQMWWKERRPEIVDMYEKYVYGRIPKDVPNVTWTVGTVDHEFLGFTPVTAKELIGTVDNSAYPAITVKIHAIEVLPVAARGKVPVLIMFGPARFPSPNEPRGDELAKVNKAMKALLVQQDPSLQQVFDRHPAWDPMKEPAFFARPELNEDGDPPNMWQLAAAGWGFVLLDTASVQADDDAGLTRGIIGLVNKGQPRTPEDWGSLRAWGWGAGRVLDYLETDPAADAKHVGIEGCLLYTSLMSKQSGRMPRQFSYRYECQLHAAECTIVGPSKSLFTGARRITSDTNEEHPRGAKPMRRLNVLFACGLNAFVACSLVVVAGGEAVAQNAPPPPVTFTSEEDHQNMMGQLGITALRPGPSGNEKACLLYTSRCV